MQQKWQESRNYRRFKDENGEVLRRVITVDGQDIEVGEEVFLAYSQAERRERYIAEEVEPGLVLSLDKLLEDGFPLEKYTQERVETVEEIVLNQESLEENARLTSVLPEALAELREEDRELIYAIFFEGESIRNYAKRYGWCFQTVPYKRDMALKRLKKKILEKISKKH